MSPGSTSRRASGGPPGLLVGVATLGVAFFLLPLVALLLEAPWADLGPILSSSTVSDAVRLSLLSSILAAAVSGLVGVPLAVVLARLDFPGRPLVRGVVTLPLVLPPVVGGAALLFALGRRGVLGGPLEASGVTLPFSLWGVVIATTFVAMPLVVITVEGGLRAMDARFEGVAASLGATRWVVFRRVTLPMIRPSVVSGLLLAWARAFGEFGATIAFAGNLPGRTQTLPLAVFVELQSDRDAAVAVSLLMVGVALLVLVALRDRWWRAS